MGIIEQYSQYGPANLGRDNKTLYKFGVVKGKQMSRTQKVFRGHWEVGFLFQAGKNAPIRLFDVREKPVIGVEVRTFTDWRTARRETLAWAAELPEPKR